MKLIKKKIPEKCLDCNMEEEYRPLNPGCCGVCIQNKKASQSKEREEK